jgi:predicted  nucleic acid-binding Zn-ribbon protein
VVEASELHRLYTPLREAVTDAPEITELRARLNDALDQIQDLRRQRDRAEDERRRAQEQLADQRAAPAGRAWWPWVRG